LNSGREVVKILFGVLTGHHGISFLKFACLFGHFAFIGFHAVKNICHPKGLACVALTLLYQQMFKALLKLLLRYATFK
jgi:hypothetical protein